HVVEEVVDELLCACRIVPTNNFMPRLQQAIGVAVSFDGSGPQDEGTLYRLLVPLNPPPGHSFHLELGT
ncbi:IPIL1 protein, partial [Anseranas semipalmata]|nr:IPIL1 protein [Anseranas semipalmata]